MRIPGEKEAFFFITLDLTLPLQRVFSFLKFNFTSSRPKEERYQLYFEDGKSPLNPKRTLSSYVGAMSYTLVWRKQLWPIHLFSEEDGKATVYCDFDAPVSHITDEISIAYGLPSLQPNQYRLKRISPDLNINKGQSLASQPIPVLPGDTLIFTMNRIARSNSISTGTILKDIPIYEENHENYSRFDEKGRLRAGNINALVTFLTSPDRSDKEWVTTCFIIRWSLAKFRKHQLFLKMPISLG